MQQQQHTHPHGITVVLEVVVEVQQNAAVKHDKCANLHITMTPAVVTARARAGAVGGCSSAHVLASTVN